jgi:hypothetical protein
MSAEGLEGPDVAFLIVADHVGVPVISANAEIHGIRAVPLVVYALDTVHPVAELKTQRALFGPVSRVTLNADLSHEFQQTGNPGNRSDQS